MRAVLIFTVFLVVYSHTTGLAEQHNTANEQVVSDYRDKICKSEKTCHLISTVNSSLHTLKERNCMCDEYCTLYGDCCEDSGYTKNNAIYKFEYFYCPSAERVYMKTSCPSNYPNQSVKFKCETSTRSLRNENKKLYIPVTNVQKNITYGNEYCAVCNNEFVYVSWNLNTHCTPIINKEPTPPTTENYHHSESSEKTSTVGNRSKKFVDYYQLNMEEAKKRVRFNSTSKTFFSEYNGTRYDCWYSRQKPASLEPHLRDCVSTISNCSIKNSTFEDLCDTSYTSIVYDELNVAYKNKYCAYCNNVTINLRGCFDQGTRITGSSIFTTFDKGSGQKPPCDNANAKVKEKFC